MREGPHDCVVLWLILSVSFLANLAVLEIFTPKIKTLWMRSVMVVGGLLLIVALPIINQVARCGR